MSRFMLVRNLFVSVLCGWSLLVQSGCGAAYAPADLHSCTMLLGDNSDPATRYTFLVEDRNVLLMVEPASAQRHAADTKFFAVTEMSLDMYQVLRQLSATPGDTDPTGAPSWRALYDHPQPGELPTAPAEAGFAARASVNANLKQLRDYVYQPKNAVQGLPNWAFRNDFVTRRLHFEGR